jgi:anti-sigma regulatory factor (Ser/Thr protein kinase)
VRPGYRIVCELKATLPATLEALEAYVEEFRSVYGPGRHSTAPFAAELLVREALVNAVEHCCHREPGRSVRCTARLHARRLTISVVDEGQGFDWRAQWCRPPNPLAASGRGLAIFRQWATWVRFNQKGNSVTILRRF